MQLIRDNLTLWTSELEDEGGNVENLWKRDIWIIYIYIYYIKKGNRKISFTKLTIILNIHSFIDPLFYICKLGVALGVIKLFILFYY
jgi:hypothetical protein